MNKPPHDWLPALMAFLQREPAVVRVVIAESQGSVPREPGAFMLVGRGAVEGTVGGGGLEWESIAAARALLDDSAASARLSKIVLAADVGQCCGGVVSVWLERFTRADLGLLQLARDAGARGSSVMSSTTCGGAVERRVYGGEVGEAGEAGGRGAAASVGRAGGADTGTVAGAGRVGGPDAGAVAGAGHASGADVGAVAGAGARPARSAGIGAVMSAGGAVAGAGRVGGPDAGAVAGAGRASGADVGAVAGAGAGHASSAGVGAVMSAGGAVGAAAIAVAAAVADGGGAVSMHADALLRLPRLRARPCVLRTAAGEVTFLERLDDELPALWLYGAGHVGQALARILAELPLRLTWVDSRSELFPTALPNEVRLRPDADSLATVSEAPAETYFLVMTHSHALDYELVRAILRRNDFAWLGLIGSQSKAARFRSRLSRDGVGADRIARLVCPIGVPGIESKWPAAIAVGVAAQVMQAMSAAGSDARHERRPPGVGLPTPPESGRLRASALGLSRAREVGQSQLPEMGLLTTAPPGADCGQESCSTCGTHRRLE